MLTSIEKAVPKMNVPTNIAQLLPSVLFMMAPAIMAIRPIMLKMPHRTASQRHLGWGCVAIGVRFLVCFGFGA